jgi:hypothetical protein
LTSADWLLVGKEAVRAYLNDASDYKLKKWLAAGMPVWVESGEWVAHKKNIEEWFYKQTRVKVRADDADLPPSGGRGDLAGFEAYHQKP